MSDKNTELLAFAKDVAKEAGAILLNYFDISPDALDVQLKQDSSPATIADREVNQLVIDRVAAAFPDHGVLAEEGSVDAHRKQLWVCDPLDGTKTYIIRIPTALFSLAFVVDGQPEVAVINDPFQAKIFSAVRGRGAWANDQPIHVSTHENLQGAKIAVSSSYPDMQKRRQLFDDFVAHNDVKIVVESGNVFKSTLVASGHVDGYIFPGRSAHDMAAAKLIIEEAGGKVTDLRGDEQRYDSSIFGAIVTNNNGDIHDEIVRLINEFGVDSYVGH